MSRPSRRAALAGIAGLALTRRLAANESDANLPALRDSMARFAQPVRVGDLAGRYLLAPSEAQHVLGYVATTPVVRTADGSLLLVVDRDGLFGFATTRVAVPLDDVALLGEHVTLIGLTRGALAALPRFMPKDFTSLPADAHIRVAIVGPFH